MFKNILLIPLLFFPRFVSAQDSLHIKYKKLVWCDEFNYTGLPDSTKWDYEVGFIRNHEEEYYTNKRKENIYVHNGYLEIIPHKEPYPNKDYQKGSDDWTKKDSLTKYTSASINTYNKASWTYGRIEVKAKLPATFGLWPAIWMMGITANKVGWPACGEIDIMEYLSKESTAISCAIHHANIAHSSYVSSTSKIEITQPHAFHTYAMEWDSTEIRMYCDGILHLTYNVTTAEMPEGNPLKQPFYMLLNLAMGGPNAGVIDDSKPLDSFLIDYVRIYQ